MQQAYFQSDSEAYASPVQDLFFSNNIVCDVQFGVPSNDGSCVQVGICRIMPDVAPQPSEASAASRRCQRALATASVDAAGRLTLFFSRTDLRPCTERAIFRNGYFPVPVAYRLPDSMLAQLPSQAVPEVPTGKYRIEALPGGYRISF